MNQDHVFYSSVDPAEGQKHYFLSGLDGLRAIAVLLVLIYHLWPQALPGGIIGVDIFFVISGYLITALLLREGAYTGKMNIVSFWVRRARRLLPAIVVLVATVGTLAFLIHGDVQVGLGRQIAGAFTFSSNWLYIVAGNDYFTQTSPELLTNFWSLAVEEQFYIFWPVILVLIFMSVSRWSRRALVPLVLGLLSLLIATVLSLTGAGVNRIYYGTDTHLFGLMIGVILAMLIPWSMYPPVDQRLYSVIGYGNRLAGVGRAIAGWVCLVAVLGLATVLHDNSPALMPWGLLLASVLAAGIIQSLLADVRNPLAALLRLILSFPPLVWIGERSYGIYLWHWPLHVLAHYIFGASAGAWVEPTVLIATLVVSGLSYMYIEEPVRRLGFRAVGARWLTAVHGSARAFPITGAAVLVLGLGGAGAAVATAPQLTEAEAVVAAGSGDQQDGAVQVSGSTGAQTQESVQAPPVSIVGDSVTVASSTALQRLLPQAAIDAKVSRNLAGELPALEQQADDGKLSKIVVLSLSTNSTMTADMLTETVNRLSPGGERKLIFVTGAAPSNLTWVTQSNELIQAVAKKYPGVVSIADWAATASEHADYLVSDGVHPTEAGQQAYAQTIADAVAAVQQQESQGSAGNDSAHESPSAEPIAPATSPAW